ncbi:MAG: ABC transporter permease [Demequinaceae bacterium]|nr:ABC transporter permease [Demequinaceae bacterium]
MRRPGFWTLTRERTVAELRIFFREKDSLIFVFLFPTMFLLLFAALMGSMDVTEGMNSPIVVNFKQYFLPGMVATGIIYTGFQNLAISIPVERDQGVLKRLRGTPLPPAVYFAAKVIQVYAVSILQLGLLLIVARFVLGIPLPSDVDSWIRFGWVFLLGAATCTALGIAFSSVPRTGKSAGAVVIPVVLILQFLSGIYFPFSQIPEWVQTFSGFFPLRWMAQAMRSVFLPDFMVSQEPGGTWALGTGAIVMSAWLVVSLALALKTFRWSSRKDG